MIYNYEVLKNAPGNLSLIIMFEFLGKLKNASLKPGGIDSDCPPILYWRFEEDNEEVNKFIADVVNKFSWEEEWVIEGRGDQKWLLFPKRIIEAERIAKGVDDGNIEVTDAGVVWLMKNDPEFSRRANRDLDRFRKYFRSSIENYLKEKEIDLYVKK